MPPEALPVRALEEEIVAAARRTRRLVLRAPTGSGKSTQVPQILADRGLAGDGEIVVLQPRRLAARLLAARVAAERGGRLGAEVGYQVRFESAASEHTRIRFVTEGILLRRMLSEPALPGVAAVIFDEFHERHLYGDITLARAVELQARDRPDLLIAVMSATLDSAALREYLAPCELLESEGRTFPVAVEYLPRAPRDDEPVWDLAAAAAERLLRERPSGDLLVFMPGAYEIGRTVNAVRARCSGIAVLPLHGELPPAEQDAAVAPCGRRKVIVSTNVAETSITIDGVTAVIDSGLARVARHDPHRGIDTLLIEKISRASADQRAGRAGRTAPGRCVRLWTERDHAHRPARDLPEVHRMDLAEVVLSLKAAGYADSAAFRWLDAPHPGALGRAEQLLADLGASEGVNGPITPLGRKMLEFPLHPRYARMLLEAGRLRCVPAATLIAALTQGRPILERNPARSAAEARDDLLGTGARSDFFVLIRAWNYARKTGFDTARCRALGIHAAACRDAARLHDQFLRIARDAGLDTDAGASDDAAVARCILAGFADHVARRLDRGTLRCELVHGRRGTLARESVVRDAELIVAAEVREIEGRDLNVILSLATAIEPGWLREMFPGAFREEQTAFYDAPSRRVVAERRSLFRDLALETARTEEVAPELAAAILAREVLAGNLRIDAWDHSVETWITRLNRLRDWMPELGLPALGPDDRAALLEQICLGARSYREIKDRPVADAVRSWLSPEQQAQLERFAPERIELPNGRRSKVAYTETGPPSIAARIQDLYGVKGELRIAAGRVPLVIHVLAPNHRPIQVTQDLSVFWREAYPEVKQQLQRRYPRHEWRQLDSP